MPGLTFIKILGNLKFFTHGLKLGTEWKSSFSIKDEAQFHSGDRKAIPQLIPPWFMAAEMPNKYHQETCDKIGKEYKDFHDTMLDAIGFAHNMWKLQAKFKDLKVNAQASRSASRSGRTRSWCRDCPGTRHSSSSPARWRRRCRTSRCRSSAAPRR